MKYQLTDEQIELFRSITPLTIDGKRVPYTIFCDGKWHKDPRGTSQCTVFIRDYSCKVDTRFLETKTILQEHFVKFMSNLFEEYAEDYQAIVEQQAEKNAKAQS